MRYLTSKRAKENGKFYWENPTDHENVLVLFKNQVGGISVAVSEERAMDSYNSTFECSAFLDAADAIRLRDYLNAAFPQPVKTESEG